MEQENKEKLEQKRQPNLRKVMIWTFVVSIVTMLVVYMYSYVFPYPLKPAELERYFSHYEDFDYISSTTPRILRKGNTIWADGRFVDNIKKWEIQGEIISINQTRRTDNSFVIIFRNNDKYFARIFTYYLNGIKNEFEIMGDTYISSINRKEGVSFFVLDNNSNALYEYFTTGKVGRVIKLSKNAKAYGVYPGYQDGLLIIEENELIYLYNDQILKKPYRLFGKPFIISYPYGYGSLDNYIIIYNGKQFDLYWANDLDYISTVELPNKFSQVYDYSMFLNSSDGTYVAYVNVGENDKKRVIIKKILDEPVDPLRIDINHINLSNILVFTQYENGKTNLKLIQYCFEGYNSSSWRHQVIENKFHFDGDVEQIFTFGFRSYYIKTNDSSIYLIPEILGMEDNRYALINTIPYKRLDRKINWFLDRLSMNIYQRILNIHRDMSFENVFSTIIQILGLGLIILFVALIIKKLLIPINKLRNKDRSNQS